MPDPNRTLIAAVGKLTTQVRRIADAMPTAVVETETGVADDTTTPTDTAPKVISHWIPTTPEMHRERTEMSRLLTGYIDAQIAERNATVQAQTTGDDVASACRVMETRTCPPSYNGPCGDRPCARFESDDPAPWLPTPEEAVTGFVGPPRTGANEADRLRAARRASLRNLINRLDRHVTGYDEEHVLLRRHVEAEISEHDRAQQQAARLEPAIIEQERLADELAAAREEVTYLQQLTDDTKDATVTERIPLDRMTSDQLDMLYEQLALLERGARERSALLEEARDALEQAGIREAQGGESWPRLVPAIEELAAERNAARDRLNFNDRDTPLSPATTPDDTPTATPPACGDRLTSYPGTVCTSLPGHGGPHGGPFIVNGRETGGAAWGPDQPTT